MVSRFSQLKRLDDVSRLLAESQSLKEVKAIRDKAEAARHYAQSAALGFRIQNQAAELKLRAERCAGELLLELAPHGGNRRSSSQDGNLKLADIGINANQSARWRREAAVSDDVFEQYVAISNEQGRDITAQGLLRLERSAANQRTSGLRNSHAIDRDLRVQAKGQARDEPDPNQAGELIDELYNHHILLASILKPVCVGINLGIPERHMVTRMLRECKEMLTELSEHYGIRQS